MTAFAIRGVIEGFYGNPWTHEQRLDHIRFIGRHGMNTFVYGPKDDPLVRRRWREPYDEAALARLGEDLVCRFAQTLAGPFDRLDPGGKSVRAEPLEREMHAGETSATIVG